MGFIALLQYPSQKNILTRIAGTGILNESNGKLKKLFLLDESIFIENKSKINI